MEYLLYFAALWFSLLAFDAWGIQLDWKTFPQWVRPLKYWTEEKE